MNDVQFEILNALYKIRIEAQNREDDEINPNIYDGIKEIDLLNRQNLGSIGLDISDEILKIDFYQLVILKHIHKVDMEIAIFGNLTKLEVYQITDTGVYALIPEIEKRELQKTKLELEIELLRSNNKVNGYQFWIKWSMIATAIFTFFSLIISYKQYKIQEINKKSATSVEIQHNKNLNYSSNPHVLIDTSRVKPSTRKP